MYEISTSNNHIKREKIIQKWIEGDSLDSLCHGYLDVKVGHFQVHDIITNYNFKFSDETKKYVKEAKNANELVLASRMMLKDIGILQWTDDCPVSIKENISCGYPNFLINGFQTVGITIYPTDDITTYLHEFAHFLQYQRKILPNGETTHGSFFMKLEESLIVGITF
jgi:hypothetical protein